MNLSVPNDTLGWQCLIAPEHLSCSRRCATLLLSHYQHDIVRFSVVHMAILVFFTMATTNQPNHMKNRTWIHTYLSGAFAILASSVSLSSTSGESPAAYTWIPVCATLRQPCSVRSSFFSFFAKAKCEALIIQSS